jgi:hypothetical protein
MSARATIPDRSEIGPNTPLRIDVAAAVAYPDGSMGTKGLRREAARGRLVIERVAGKDYTTLAHIDRMREQCRLVVKAQDSNCDRPDAAPDVSPIPPPGASSTDDISAAQAAAQIIVEELSGRSRNTSPKNTSRKRGADNVIRLASR